MKYKSPPGSLTLGWLLMAMLCLAPLADAQSTRLTFEDLGEPVRGANLALRCITRDATGHFMAWGAHEAADKYALIGVDLDNGKVTWVETTHFGNRHIQMITGADGNLYAFTGVPGRFLKYDVTSHKLTDLGVPAPKGTYWMGNSVGPDGNFYIGTYPNTELVRCDPATGKVENLGRVATDPKELYIVSPAVSDENIVYCPVGQHHAELWSVDARTFEKTQILPPSLTKTQGAPIVWIGTDGQAYGQVGKTQFLCKRDGIEIGKTQPRRYEVNRMMAGDQKVAGIDAGGQVTLTNSKTKKQTVLHTNYTGAPRLIYSVSCERDGRIYGGTVEPPDSFSYDTRTGQMTDLGKMASGSVQLYDTLSNPKGLFLSSYMNASVDFFDPAKPLDTADNPRHIVTVDGQERPTQITTGPDGKIYTGTVPAKGRLGGVLVRVDPEDFTSKVWNNVIPNQSILRFAAVPETGELFCTSSIGGGSSAIPTEKEACVFLWDCKREAVVFRAQPLPGAKSYGAVVRARNGIIYGVSAGQYYAFDPRSRKVIFTGKLPVKAMRFPELSDDPVGKRGLIFGIGDGAVFTIDPADHSAKIVARDPSLAKALGFYVTRDEVLYYGAGAHLMRCKLGGAGLN